MPLLREKSNSEISLHDLLRVEKEKGSKNRKPLSFIFNGIVTPE
jgi:hypothetical protein